MRLLKKTASRPEMGPMGHMAQAGRTESSMAAERDSMAGNSVVSNPFTSDSNLLRTLSSTSHLEMQSPASSHPLSRTASHAPAVPSPLNPSSSRTSVDSSEDNLEMQSPRRPSDTSSDNPRSQNAGNPAATGRGRRAGAAALSPAQQILRDRSIAALPPGGFERPETPKHLADLGSDYSRYPSSVSLLSTSRPPANRNLRSTGSTAPLLRTTTNNPFNDSQADLEKFGYPDDSIGVFDPYCGGEKGFILYPNEVEADDDFHMPKDDDDITYKPSFMDYFGDTRSIVSAIGAAFLVLGLLCVFIILPVLTFTTHYITGGGGKYVANTGPAWAHVNNKTYALLKSARKGTIDPDTPDSAMTRQSTFDGSALNLVFSDEFNEDGRTFYPGDDPYWTAPDIWYGATQDLEWYDPDAVTTANGTLQLKLDKYPNHNLQYRSGMLNSWNQLCFKGGVFEVSVSLAGPSGIPGLWPGAWTMGNLGRPGYKATTEGVWPYTYNTCDIGITPNQSSPDGLSFLPGQRLSSCTCKGEDHPNPGTGRGAPEIDILEGSVDPNNRIGVVTQSFQVAPFDVFWRPNNDFMAIPNYNTTQMNTYCGGPFQQAVSGTTLLNNNWYDGNQYQKYAFEYVPGTSQGKIAWFVGEDPSFIMDGRAIGPNGNVAARQVSQEPMSMILNLGISNSWSQILFADLEFPTVMNVDYVRIYQKAGQEMLTCDPPGYPTTDYIQDHLAAYTNPNLTSWESTGYAWPKNTIVNGCAR